MWRARRFLATLLVGVALQGTLSAAPAGPAPAAAGSLEDRFRDGLKAGWDGRPDAAWEHLFALWETYGVRRPALAYDLGAIALQRGEPARAVYFFRLASLLNPSADLSEEIASGLDAARHRLVAAADRDVHRQHLVYGDVTGAAYAALHRVGEATLAWLAVALAALFTGVFAWARGRSGPGTRLAPIVVALVFGLAAGAWALRIVQDETIVIGVVVTDEATLHEALDPAAPTHLVPGGTEVLVLEQHEGEQVRVRLPTGRKGWLPREDVGLLRAFPAG